MSSFLKTVLVVCLVALGGLIGQGIISAQAQETHMLFNESVDGKAKAFETSEIEIKTPDGETYYFDVEMALDHKQHAQGLMFRKFLETNAGMLFIFDNVKKRAFWMKNTLIPLDMLFVSSDGIIHHIHHNAKPQDLTTVTSKYPSKAVLELSGGSADKLGIKEGSEIIHAVFNNVGVIK